MEKIKQLMKKIKQFLDKFIHKIFENFKDCRNNPRKMMYNVIRAVLILVILGSGGYLISYYVSDFRSDKQFDELQDIVNDVEDDKDDSPGTSDEDSADGENGTGALDEPTYYSVEVNGEKVYVPKKNIDWDALYEVNEHIYAWICVPGTIIDYPVLQHPTENDYYLHMTLDHQYSLDGNIYTQVQYNSKDFTDSNTVMYGHNRRSNGKMFRTLHNFEDPYFFKAYQYIFIYTEAGVYIYHVFAAYETSSAHQIANYPTDTTESFNAYVDMALRKASEKGHYRDITDDEHLGRILTLSTCIGDEKHLRYLVQGFLVYDPTLE